MVVPWTEQLYQYTVKDVARPVTGTLWVDGQAYELEPGASWATLDHGRARWRRDVQWNWGAGSGTVDGRTVGLQLGGRWTVGTGSTENAVLLDGRLSRIGSELGWTYSARDWMAPTASTAGRRTSTSAGDARRMFCHARGMTSPPAPGRDAARPVSSGDPVAVPSASRRQGPTASSAGGLVTCTVVRGVAPVSYTHLTLPTILLV